jgi:gas vesicle protein
MSEQEKQDTMPSQGMQGAKMAALIAGGAIIGAGLGLLFAPKTGVETRRDVSRYAKKAQVQATRWSRAMQSGVKKTFDRRGEEVREQARQPELQAALN